MQQKDVTIADARIDEQSIRLSGRENATSRDFSEVISLTNGEGTLTIDNSNPAGGTKVLSFDTKQLTADGVDLLVHDQTADVSENYSSGEVRPAFVIALIPEIPLIVTILEGLYQ